MPSQTQDFWDRGWEIMSAPLPITAVYAREAKKGLYLLYTDERVAIARLNVAYGSGSWQRTFQVLQTRREMLRDTTNPQVQRVIIEDVPSMVQCLITISDGKEQITRAGIADASNVEEEKGAASDAFKRACVPFGMLYLYFMGRYLSQLGLLTATQVQHHLADNLKKHTPAYLQWLQDVQQSMLSTAPITEVL